MKKKLFIMMSTMLACACVLIACGGENAGNESSTVSNIETEESKVATTVSEENESEAVELKENDASDFHYEEVEGQIIITGYHGERADVVIPAMINGKEVVGIGTTAFINNKDVISVVCPDTLKEIQTSAFLNTTNLTNIQFNDGLERVEEQAFNGSGIQKVIMPDSITYVGNGAFCSEYVTEIKISESMTELPIGCFMYADITTVTVPGNIKKVNDAFYGCENLQKMVLEEGVEVIAYGAFPNCEALTSVEIPASVTEIVGVTAAECAHIVFTVPAGSYAEQYMIDKGLNYVTQ